MTLTTLDQKGSRPGSPLSCRTMSYRFGPGKSDGSWASAALAGPKCQADEAALPGSGGSTWSGRTGVGEPDVGATVGERARKLRCKAGVVALGVAMGGKG